MLGEFGKFDQRILPASDTVRITPYALNKAVKREDKQAFRRNKQQKQGLSYEEKITISSSVDPEELPGVFDEYKDVEEWVSIQSLLANASMRLKLLTVDEDLREENNDDVLPAYAAYQTAVNRNRIENNLSFEEKVELSDIIDNETDEERLSEISHLNELIPGLQALLDAGYTHMPLIAEKSLLDTAGKALSEL